MRLSPCLCLIALLGLAACSSLPKHIERSPTYALAASESTLLGQFIQPQLTTHPGLSGFHPLPNGVDALLARILLAEAAQRSLDVQYYIWHDDLTGRHFANSLLRAADRGVRVRILIDDVGVSARDEVLLSLDAHPNVEIRLFNPIASRTFRNFSALTDISRVNRRMHNKAFIADNQAAILGGRNIGDEYFGASGDVAFNDLDVLTVGRGVADISAAFDVFWNAEESYPVASLHERADQAEAMQALREKLTAFVAAQEGSPYVSYAKASLAERLAAGMSDFHWGVAHLLYDRPDKVSRAPQETTGNLLPQLGRLNLRPQQSLLIVSPYFVPGEAGVSWLGHLVSQGVRVTVLTNSLAATDVGAVHAGYKRYREALVAAGVRLYEVRPQVSEAAGKKHMGSSRASLHAKTFVFDRRAVFIGSMNLDPRSVQLNTEIGVVCDSAELAALLGDGIEANLNRIAWRLEQQPDERGEARLVWLEGDTPRYDSEPEVSLWRRLGVWFLGLLPIESQL